MFISSSGQGRCNFVASSAGLDDDAKTRKYELVRNLKTEDLTFAQSPP